MSDFMLGAVGFVLMLKYRAWLGTKTLSIGLLLLGLAVAMRHYYYDYNSLLVIKRLIIGVPMMIVVSLTQVHLNYRALQWLGKISYGLYIYHTLGIWLAGFTLRALHDSLFSVIVLEPILAFAITIACASISFYVIEQPIILWSKKKW